MAPEARGITLAIRTFRRLLGCSALVLAVTPFAAPAAELEPRSGGPQAPLVLETLDGVVVDLASFEGRPVLVHFFATWCEPCIPEMAALQRLAASPRGDRLHIVTVDVGEVDARVRRFRDAQGLTFPVLMDRDRAAARAWGVVGLPTTFVLGGGRGTGLAAEGDVDWDAPATGAALDRIIGPTPDATRQDDMREDWKS